MKRKISVIKSKLERLKQSLGIDFSNQVNIGTITNHLVNGIDEIILHLFYEHISKNDPPITLLALGSYGRRELQLYSDIDLLIIHDAPLQPHLIEKLQRFIQGCWDVGLEISHQISTIEACSKLAGEDLTVISSILDMRLLCGNAALMEKLTYQIHPLHIWNSHDFYFSKMSEQKKRYKQYDETAYNLEPNVKKGPGGLRDIHLLVQICQRHFGTKKLAEGIRFGFVTPKEYEELLECQRFLWKVRFGLHFITQKKEDRLLFDIQSKIAGLFDYKDTSKSLAIEQFMKAYFTVIKRCRELNEIILQWFSETIVYHQKQKITPLNDIFQLSNNYLEIKHSKVFLHRPEALVEIFLLLANNPEIKGVRANTIRLIRQHLFLIDKNFCTNKTINKLFLSIFKSQHSPYQALQRMSRYGVLGYYLDPFSKVTGQMQYDLFHVYTVDQHTLFVIRNIGDFLNSSQPKSFHLCHQIFLKIKHKEILYLAALFHDIAKGQGGDHSELGALEVQDFSRRHQLNKAQTNLVVWLVENHLLMSQTAQRKDIYDPQIIQEFCDQLPKPDYLDFLYLLTVADICATNPSLWNGWKDSLLKELYFSAKNVMNNEIDNLDENKLILDKKNKALAILNHKNIQTIKINTLWSHFNKKYFLHESPEIIAKHTDAILNAAEFPLVLILPHHSEGGTEIFIYMPHRDDRFSVATTILTNHHMTIQEASISTTPHGFDLDTYIVLDDKTQQPILEKNIKPLQIALIDALKQKHIIPDILSRRLTRVQAHFNIPPKVKFKTNLDKQATELFLIATDRPGLLALISRVFVENDIQLYSAKIATVGERVEDTFIVSSKENGALSKEKKTILKQQLLERLTKI